MAQRVPAANIWAIEPHDMALKDARRNFDDSPFNDRLHLKNSDLNAFRPGQIKFDLIICNPPFFPNGYALPDSGRAMARKAEFLSPRELASAIRLLRKGGRLAVIYPVDIFEEFSAEMSSIGWNLHRRADIRPTPRKEIHRTMGEFAEGILRTERSEIVIEEKGRHLYSEAYMALTHPFYLKLPDEIT
jgi:tRNA1Val (adenine37-N6)-methyltransferase